MSDRSFSLLSQMQRERERERERESNLTLLELGVASHVREHDGHHHLRVGAELTSTSEAIIATTTITTIITTIMTKRTALAH